MFTTYTDWGECQQHRYAHLKHNNPTQGRGISIHKAGTCKDWKANLVLANELKAHLEFFPEKGRVS